MPPKRLRKFLTCALMLVAGPAFSAGSAPEVTISWSAPGAGLRSAAFDPTGKRIALTWAGGRIDCRSVSGANVWSTTVSGATSAVLAPGASYALAYSKLDPSRTSVVILDASGRVVWEKEVTGAVWCADACRTKDGARFVVGTGERYVYVFDVGEHRRRYRRWRTPGVVASITVQPDGERVCYGTWQNSTVGCATVRGQRIWESKRDPASLQYIERLASCRRLFLRSIPNNPILNGEFAVLNSDGSVRWNGKLDSSRRARALVSPNGRYVCVGYTKAISHKGVAEREEHAVLYNGSGRRVWEKGSLFFRAYPLLVTSGGWVLVQGAENELFWVGLSAEPEPSIKLGARVRLSWTSRDGSHALMLCSDGKLRLLSGLAGN